MPRPPGALPALRALLDEGAELSMNDITRTLGITDRHARRLLKDLAKDGLPVASRRESGRKLFFLPEEHRQATLQQISFSEEEALALTVAAEAARATLAATPLGRPLERAFDKLLAELAPNIYSFSLEEQPSHWHFGTTGLTPIDAEVFRTLSRAIEARRTVRIDYYTASRNTLTRGRRIDPLMIGMPGGSWVVVAWCHRRQKILDFALGGIQTIEATNDYFSPPNHFDPEFYFRDRFGSLAGEVMTIRLLVDRARAPYFSRKHYHPTQQIEEERPDGSIVVSFEASGLETLRAFCLSWGEGVTVLDPPELIARMREEATVLARRYADGAKHPGKT